MTQINRDFRYNTDQVRRYAHHMQHGGKLRQTDIDNCVAICERKDTTIDQLLTEVDSLKEYIASLELKNAKMEKQQTDASWANNPDRSGGAFTEIEKSERSDGW